MGSCLILLMKADLKPKELSTSSIVHLMRYRPTTNKLLTTKIAAKIKNVTSHK